jgi:2-polyprenyl-3-methyl-5-hydroxy-6-metoxy-1,4-benzoquinol methylase
LDLGCGIGYGSTNLLRKGAKAVVGGDISADATRTANKKYSGTKNLHFVTLDGTKLPFKTGALDLIVAFEVIEHIPAYESFLSSEIVRCSKPDGSFVCSTPNKEISSPGSEKPSVREHFKEFYIWELQNVLEVWFHDIVLYGQELSW